MKKEREGSFIDQGIDEQKIQTLLVINSLLQIKHRITGWDVLWIQVVFKP
jgi:hypothetical protein